MKSLRDKRGFAAYQAVAIAGAAAAPLTVMANFSGDYAVTPPAAGSYSDANATGTFGNWTGSWNGLGGVTLDTSLSPSQISIDLHDSNLDMGGDYTFLVKAAASGLVSFNDVVFQSGIATAIKFIDQTTSASFDLTGGAFSAPVSAGDIFGFELSFGYEAHDILTVSNFSAPEPAPGGGGNGVPEGGSALESLAFGFIGLLAYRAAAKRRSVIGG